MGPRSGVTAEETPGAAALEEAGDGPPRGLPRERSPATP